MNTLAGTTALSLALLCTTASAQIRWEASLDAALEDAKELKTVVMVALNMPGEPASDELEAEHYKDKVIRELSKHSVNLIYHVGPTGSSNPDERRVRESFLGATAGDPVAVPHHLFLDPREEGGKLISSVAYKLTKGQLEWIWVDAIQKVNPEFEWELSDRARAPEGMRVNGAEGGTGDMPPSEEELKSALKEIKKNGGGRGGRGRGANWMRTLELFNVIVRSPEKPALKYAETSLRAIGGGFLRSALRTIGDKSPEIWWTIASPYLESRSRSTREEAARALEKLAAPKSLSPLKKAWKSESDDKVRGRMLRALASAGPTDKTVTKTLGKVLQKDKSPDVRAQAAAAVSVLENPEVVRKHLETALEDEHAKVRTAAAYAIASRRDKDLAAILQKKAANERDAEAKEWMQKAIEVVEGGELRAFRAFVKDVLGDRTQTAEQNLRDMWNRRNRDNDGEEDGEGDTDKDGGGRRRRGR